MDLDNSKEIESYISNVKSGKIPTGKLVRKAIDRHLNDLKTGAERGLYFDKDSANRIINFFRILRFTKGTYAKENFELEPFQKFQFWVLFGWKRDDGTRRFRKAYIEVARKSGKTELAGGLGDYMLGFDGEQGGEIYSAATKQPQAKIVFDAAKKMMLSLRRDSKDAETRFGTSLNSIFDLETGSKFEPLSSESDKQDGLDPSLAIIDEYHAHKKSDLLEVLETGMGARSQPLLFIITTAGFDKESPCYKLRKVCIDILYGKKTDDSLFCIIYTLDEDDDWKDESTWIKANPNIGRTPTWDYMKDQFIKARNEGLSKEVQFKTKNLNIWTDSYMSWINDETWMKCSGELPDLTGKECFAGLDLAAVSDSNSLTLLFPVQEGLDNRCSLHFFWIPEETVEAKSGKADYREWVRDGFMTTTEGNVVDHRFMIEDISRLLGKYYFKAIAFDRYLAYHGVVQELMSLGAPMIEFGQGYKSMSPPTKELEQVVKSGKLNHGGNPVMRWMMGNVVIEIDPTDAIKINKAKSGEKVDGPVSLVMALAMEMSKPEIEETGSMYD